MKIDFDIESRDYNGRWYTNIKAWKIEKAGSQNQNISNGSVMVNREFPENEDDGLPF